MAIKFRFIEKSTNPDTNRHQLYQIQGGIIISNLHLTLSSPIRYKELSVDDEYVVEFIFVAVTSVLPMPTKTNTWRVCMMESGGLAGSSSCKTMIQC